MLYIIYDFNENNFWRISVADIASSVVNCFDPIVVIAQYMVRGIYLLLLITNLGNMTDINQYKYKTLRLENESSVSIYHFLLSCYVFLVLRGLLVVTSCFTCLVINKANISILLQQ